MIFHRMLCALILSICSAGIIYSEEPESVSVRDTYLALSTSQIKEYKDGALQGDLDSMLHYGLYCLTQKKLQETFFWMEAFSMRVQLEDVCDQESVQGLPFIASLMLGSLIMEMQEAGAKFEEHLKKAVELYKDVEHKNALLFIEKLEAKRPKDALSAKRAAVIDEIKNAKE